MKKCSAVHSSYLTLLGEAPGNAIAWFSSGALLTVSQMTREAEKETVVGTAYLKAVLAQALRFVSDSKVPVDLTMLPIDVTPRFPVTELLRSMPKELVVWKTMSRCSTAQDMAMLLEERDPDGLTYLSDALRISRDFVGRAAADQAEAPRA